MADFLLADEGTVDSEGVWDLNKNDPGNWTGGKVNVGSLVGTKYGVIWSDFKQVYGRVPTQTDMRALSYEQAQHIRKVLYWDTINGDDINVQHFAKEIYDTNLNTGGRSVPIIVGQALQMALKNKVGLDDATIKILNSLSNEKNNLSGNNLA
jgi:lysozyme family protein